MTAAPPISPDWLDFAAALARESGELILRHFRGPLDVERKADRTPVTVADREAEALLRRRIAGRFPEHQVLGEEAGRSGPPDAEYRWVVDPIDGTRSFIHGVPLFGTLIGLQHHEEPVLGVIHLPATGELMVGATGHRTTVNGRPVRVSPTATLADATLLLTCPATLFDTGYGPAFHRLRRRVGLVRGWGDCYGHFLVAAGRAEIMLDPVLNLWDLVALKPCVEGAGGRISAVGGEGPPRSDALSTNGRLHEAVAALLRDA